MKPQIEGNIKKDREHEQNNEKNQNIKLEWVKLSLEFKDVLL